MGVANSMSKTKKTMANDFRTSQLAYAGFTLYRDLFDWFAAPMTALDLNGLNAKDSDIPGIKAAWDRADKEWEQLTGLKPPLDEQAWQDVSQAVGWTNIRDVHGMKNAVLEWARGKREGSC